MQSSLHANDDRGFVLVAVIWIAAIFAVVAFIVTSAVRTRVRMVEAEVASAEAEAAADAGLNLALFELIGNRSSGGEPAAPSSAVKACRMDDRASVFIQVRDEAGKVDLNLASSDLLRTLMIGLGWSKTLADARVATLGDFVDADGDRRLGGAEAEDYQAAGRAIGPKNRSLEAVEELGRIIRFDEVAVREMRPHVTVHSGQTGVDPRAASRELAQILERGLRDGAIGIGGFDASASIPPQFTAASSGDVFAIHVEARTGRNAYFARDAIVDLPAQLSVTQRPVGGRAAAASRPLYRISHWRRGEAVAASATLDQWATLPPC